LYQPGRRPSTRAAIVEATLRLNHALIDELTLIVANLESHCGGPDFERHRLADVEHMVSPAGARNHMLRVCDVLKPTLLRLHDRIGPKFVGGRRLLRGRRDHVGTD